MDVDEILLELFGRLPSIVREAVDGLSAEQLAARPDPAANSIAWLVWHLTRIQDDHLADVAGREQVWADGGWAGRFGMRPGSTDTGYGHGPDDVASVRPDSEEALIGYYDAVAEVTTTYLRGLRPSDLDRVVDERWDPPVTLGVRLASVISDDLQHAGQAVYLRGLLERPG